MFSELCQSAPWPCAVASDLLDILAVPLYLLWLAALSYVLCALIVYVPRSVYLRLRGPDLKIPVMNADLLLAGVPFALLGMMIGYLTGISRESVVGATIPAVLTLIGTIAAFIAANGGRRAALATVSIVHLSFALIVGVGYGSKARVDYTQSTQSLQTRIQQINDEIDAERYRRRRLVDIENANKSQPATAQNKSQ